MKTTKKKRRKKKRKEERHCDIGRKYGGSSGKIGPGEAGQEPGRELYVRLAFGAALLRAVAALLFYIADPSRRLV